MRTRKNNKSKKSNTIFRKARKNKIKQTGNGGVLSRLINGVDERDNNICILYITTHGEIQNNDMRTIDQEEYSELDIKKINAVDMDVCNYIAGKQSIEMGNILQDYLTEIMKLEENKQDIDLETMIIQEILKQVDNSHNDAKKFKRKGEVLGKEIDYERFIQSISRAYNVYDINGGTTYYNKLFTYKKYIDYYPFKSENDYDIILIENGKSSSLLSILGKAEEFDRERMNIMDIGSWKIYLSEIIEYLYKVLHKNRIIIVDMSCGNIKDEDTMTSREVRNLRRTAEKEGTKYGGKRNTKKKIKSKKR
tara:strand:- start:322 stop:1242 length:921 start_codon:yes stop_codon:yes gene_type:complete